MTIKPLVPVSRTKSTPSVSARKTSGRHLRDDGQEGRGVIEGSWDDGQKG